MTRKTLSTFALVLGTLVGLSDWLDAASIPGLHNTGVNTDGVVQPIGSLEQHFAMTGLMTDAKVIQPAPPWIPAPAGAAWIGPLSGLENAPSGCCYVYKVRFDLTGYDPATAVISGALASDDGTHIFINGIDIGFSNEDVTFQILRPFTVSSGFGSGVNELEFRVDKCNEPECTFHPSGLLVANLAGNAELSAEPNLFVVGVNPGAILAYEVTPTSSTLVTVMQDPAISTPRDITFSRWGEMFVSASSQHPYLFEERPGFVRRYAAPYGVGRVSGDLGVGALVTPHGLAFRGDELLATDVGNNRIRRYHFGPRGEPQELPFITSPGFINEAVRWVVAKPDGSEIFVSQCICGGVNNVRRLRAETNGTFTDLGVLPGTFNNPHGMAFSPWGELFTANSDRVIEGSQYTNWFISRHTFESDGTPKFNGSFTHEDLRGSIALAFSPWGELFVNNQTGSNITRFVFSKDHTPVFNGSIRLPSDGIGLAFRPSGSCPPVQDLKVSITLGNDGVSAVFPAAAAEYSLDTTDSLTPPVVWRPTYATRGIVGPNLKITLPLISPTNRTEFFRLRCPNF